MTTASPLSPTSRTTLGRSRERGTDDRSALHAILAEVLVAHLGVDVGDHPVVLPVAIAVDADGPDRDGTLYVHGSVAARWLTRADRRTVCVTATLLDGLVLARSGFHHSMNYRSAVVVGEARVVTDPDELERALDLTVDHVVPGRSATLRRPTRKELAATSVLAVPLHEASVKVRAGDPVDDEPDVEAGAWAGVLPLSVVASSPESAADSHDDVPPDVTARAAQLGA
jgi:nitroimidazol reductase NimA-like FMN-containing flavoprotein (pyridoxamine 5'-phosphate oxidase superfamily)